MRALRLAPIIANPITPRSENYTFEAQPLEFAKEAGKLDGSHCGFEALVPGLGACPVDRLLQVFGGNDAQGNREVRFELHLSNTPENL